MSSKGEQTVAEVSIESLRSEFKIWLADHTPVAVEGTEDQRFEKLRAWQRELHEAGFLGLAWPQRYGGRGLTGLHQVAVYQELTSVGAPPPVGEIGLEIVGPTIVAFGTDEQCAELLPRILSATDIWCQGFSEPDAGSDLASMRTRAVAGPDGFSVRGQKTWSSWAKYATMCALLARTDPDAVPQHRGISYFLVDLDTPGVTVRPIVQVTGESEFAELFFDDLQVPADRVLGEVNKGWHYTMHTMSHERGAYLLKRHIELETRFARTVEALSDVESLDVSLIGQLGLVRVQLDMLAAQGVRTAERLSADEPSANDSVDKLTLTAVEQTLGELLSLIMTDQRTLSDGMPYGLSSADLFQSYLFGRAASIYGGTAQIQRNIIGERVLGLPKG